LILELHSALPKTGDQIVFDRYTFTVLNVDNKRISRVRVAVQQETLKHEE